MATALNGRGHSIPHDQIRSTGGFEGGFGPKGLGNLAQALAWVGVTINATSPEGAEEIVI